MAQGHIGRRLGRESARPHSSRPARSTMGRCRSAIQSPAWSKVHQGSSKSPVNALSASHAAREGNDFRRLALDEAGPSIHQFAASRTGRRAGRPPPPCRRSRGQGPFRRRDWDAVSSRLPNPETRTKPVHRDVAATHAPKLHRQRHHREWTTALLTWKNKRALGLSQLRPLREGSQLPIPTGERDARVAPFVRSFGIVQCFCSKSISSQRAPSTRQTRGP